MDYLFDIGNVLLSFDFAPALKKLTGPDADQNAFDKIIAEKDAFEAGQLSIADYLNFVYPLLDYQGTDEEFFTVWNSIFTPILPNWALVKSLKEQGHRLILFSNINPIHAPYIIEEYEVFQHFHHAVFSHEIGAIKPNSEFFTRAFDKFKITPEDTIYIDDLPQNIAMGKKLGLHSFCYDYHHHDKLLDWLTQF